MTIGSESGMERDFFALFDLPRRFLVDGGELDRRFRDIQSRVHPDKHAHLPESDRRAAMQWATLANEAYRSLKNPLLRARHLLNLAGCDVATETNTAMSPEFLVEQMTWRESVADAKTSGDLDGLEEILGAVKGRAEQEYLELQNDLDIRHDYAAAAERVRRLMFQEKLLDEINDAIEATEA